MQSALEYFQEITLQLKFFTFSRAKETAQAHSPSKNIEIIQV